MEALAYLFATFSETASIIESDERHTGAAAKHVLMVGVVVRKLGNQLMPPALAAVYYCSTYGKSESNQTKASKNRNAE
jgi:hypothetical protein